jgi:polyhydroxybutyrate depolymerase
MTGHSSGGFMSYSFAMTHSEKVAAIAPVAGLAVGVRKKPKLPVSVVSFHGMADRIVAYDSKGRARWGRGMPSAPESAEVFARFNGCDEEPVRDEQRDGKVHVDTWKHGDRGTRVTLYSIERWGHGWPQGGRRTIAASELIWKFFEQHGRKPGKAKREKPRQRKLVEGSLPSAANRRAA